MKKLALSLVAACAALVGLAADDPLADCTKYYWNKPDGGNWNTAANWVMADGTTATDYPKTATDAAIFNGINAGKWVSFSNNLTVEPGVVYLEDGFTGFYFGSGTHVHITRFLREDHAVMNCVANGYNHAQPNDFVISNRTEVLADECIPGAQWHKRDNELHQPRSVGILDTFTVKAAPDTSIQMAVDVWGSQTWGGHYSYLYGNFADNRSVKFRGNHILTIPSGQIMPLSNGSHVGTSGDYQGTIASENPVIMWAYSSDGTLFRSLVQAPKFVQASRYTTTLYDDHSVESCPYYIPNGTLALGKSSSETALIQTCKLGTGDVYVSWSGTLDVQCAGALANVGAIRMTSYRGQGSTWGKISMSVSDTVTKAYVDGKSLKRGTYGATGSGAANIDDVHFSGAGVLTVLKDDSKGLCLIIR